MGIRSKTHRRYLTISKEYEIVFDDYQSLQISLDKILSMLKEFHPKTKDNCVIDKTITKAEKILKKCKKHDDRRAQG